MTPAIQMASRANVTFDIHEYEHDSGVIPVKLSKFPIALVSWTKRQGEVTSHSRSYGEELPRSIFVQIASAIGNLESAIGITAYGAEVVAKLGHNPDQVFKTLVLKLDAPILTVAVVPVSCQLATKAFASWLLLL